MGPLVAMVEVQEVYWSRWLSPAGKWWNLIQQQPTSLESYTHNSPLYTNPSSFPIPCSINNESMVFVYP